MNILVFNWKDITHPDAGGAELHIHELAKRWIAQGHSVTLFCPRHKNSSSSQMRDKLHIIHKGGRFTVYPWAMLYYLFVLRKKGFDAIVDVENGIPFFTPLYSSVPKVCVVHHVHKEVFSKELPFYLSWLGYLLEVVLMPIVYQNVNFIAVSETTKDELVKLGVKAGNISIVHNGVDLNVYGPGRSKTANPSLIYVGRLKRYKRIDLLLEAFKKISGELPDAELAIVGAGDDESRLRALSLSLDLNSCTFHGFVSEKKKVELLQKAWLFVTPSSLEGWGLSVIEANACGVPAVAYDVPGLRDSIAHNKTGLLVSPSTPEALARAVIPLLKSAHRLRSLSQRALAHSKHFTWDESAKATILILEELK